MTERSSTSDDEGDTSVVSRPPPTTPGDLIAVILRDRGSTQAELAATMGRPAQMVNEVINGKKRVTATTALQLQVALGVPAIAWLVLQDETDLRALR